MSRHVCWMLELELQDGQEAAFTPLMNEMVESTKKEPGTLDYEWSLSADGRQCHLFERYVDSAAALVHAGTFGEKFAARFLAILKPTRCVLYGSPNDAVRQALAPLSPVEMRPVGGFSR